ncbi:4Fe-4S binding protein [Desulfogranum marinum]|uniref:4Fe-4S binding protein n=1 Tax=Desulfogranum marinum TaxID=453220 RepID=UPI0019627512|nr:4Fe-4S binding protein [Desulfogranum marinum]MBM9511304.1 4Fe-4S binding protein [Desulfogranum marinum]
MSGYWSDILVGSKSLVTGLMITARQFFRPVVTENYPYEVPEMTERFRGHIELIANEETGKPNCIACMACQRACPSDCISVAGKKMEGEKKKTVTKYVLDFTKCSLCGSCVESCKFNALRFSKEYNLVSFNKDDFIIDLVKRLEDQN